MWINKVYPFSNKNKEKKWNEWFIKRILIKDLYKFHICRKTIYSNNIYIKITVTLGKKFHRIISINLYNIKLNCTDILNKFYTWWNNKYNWNILIKKIEYNFITKGNISSTEWQCLKKKNATLKALFHLLTWQWLNQHINNAIVSTVLYSLLYRFSIPLILFLENRIFPFAFHTEIEVSLHMLYDGCWV